MKNIEADRRNKKSEAWTYIARGAVQKLVGLLEASPGPDHGARAYNLRSEPSAEQQNNIRQNLLHRFFFNPFVAIARMDKNSAIIFASVYIRPGVGGTSV